MSNTDLPEPQSELGRFFRGRFQRVFALMSEKRGASQAVWHAALFEAIEATFDEIDKELRGSK